MSNWYDDRELIKELNNEQTPEPVHISLKDVVGSGYNDFWRCKTRYRVVKGSRASKKSTTTALNIITRMMRYPKANTLVIRKVYATLKDSCFSQLLWAIDQLGVGEYWEKTESPLKLKYKPTGQVILFRGLDDPLKTTSITVHKGVLCWVWIEEAYEITESEFNTIDESIRGKLPEDLFIQLTLIFNPWDSGSWLKARFFDNPAANVFTKTTTYKCNEWLSDDDLAMFNDMQERDPDRYAAAGLGEWGIAEGQYFKQWNSNIHVIEPFDIPKDWIKFRAMDWGQARPYACLWFAIDYDGNLYAYRELYGWGGKANVGTGETADEVGKRIATLETKEENVSYGELDNACWARTGVTGPTIAESINNELIKHGLVSFGECSKGRLEGANAFKERLLGYKNSKGVVVPGIRFFSTCIHTIRTIPMIGHDKHNPELYDTTAEDHCCDAVIYGCLSRPYATPRPKAEKYSHKYEAKDEITAWSV